MRLQRIKLAIEKKLANHCSQVYFRTARSYRKPTETWAQGGIETHWQRTQARHCQQGRTQKRLHHLI